MARVDDAVDTAAEKPDVSVFREEVDVRCVSVVSWATGGSLHDDMYAARKGVMLYEKLMLQQLKISGSEWEKREQKQMADGEDRTYEICVCYDR